MIHLNGRAINGPYGPFAAVAHSLSSLPGTFLRLLSMTASSCRQPAASICPGPGRTRVPSRSSASQSALRTLDPHLRLEGATRCGSSLASLARSPLPLLVGASLVGLVALAVSPLAAVIGGGLLVVAGAVVRARGDHVTGLGLAATGGALFLAAVLVLSLAEADQDKPVILGPDTGLTPGG